MNSPVDVVARTLSNKIRTHGYVDARVSSSAQKAANYLSICGALCGDVVRWDVLRAGFHKDPTTARKKEKMAQLLWGRANQDIAKAGPETMFGALTQAMKSDTQKVMPLSRQEFAQVGVPQEVNKGFVPLGVDERCKPTVSPLVVAAELRDTLYASIDVVALPFASPSLVVKDICGACLKRAWRSLEGSFFPKDSVKDCQTAQKILFQTAWGVATAKPSDPVALKRVANLSCVPK